MMTRRALLQLFGVAPFGSVWRRPCVLNGRSGRRHGRDRSLLLGVGGLDDGIAWVEGRTGVRAVVGGKHPGAGTRILPPSFYQTDGPFESPQDFARFNLFGRFHTHLSEDTRLMVTASGRR